MRSPVLLTGYCALGLQVYLVDATVQLIVSPANILPNLTTSLWVNCTFSYQNASNIADLVSLTISKNHHHNNSNSTVTFQDLASINEFTPGQVNIVNPTGATTSGHISTTGTSYLSLLWTHPSAGEAGIYRCTARGLDNVGQSEVTERVAEVTASNAGVSNPEVDQLLELVRQQQTQMDAMSKLLANLTADLAKVNTELKTLYTDFRSLNTTSTSLSGVSNDLNALNKTIHESLNETKNECSALNLTVYDSLANVHVDVSKINNTFNSALANVNNDISTLNETIYTNLANVDNNVCPSNNTYCEGLASQINILNITVTDGLFNLDRAVTSLNGSDDFNFAKVERYKDAYVLIEDIRLSFERSKDYIGSYYLLANEAPYHDYEAQSRCYLSGGYLAEINDAPEHEFIKGFLNTTDPRYSKNVMVGANDEYRESRFVWSYSQKRMTYTDWDPGEPSMKGVGCVFLFRPSDWTMFEDDCSKSATYFTYLCEIPIL